MFCVYLTVYFGELLPRRYIGSSSIKNVLNGYNGSVGSKRWKDVYLSEQKNNKHLFRTRILSVHPTSAEAIVQENFLHIKYDVVKSQLYFNESEARINGYFGRDVSGKNNPMYGKCRRGETHKGGENISLGLKKTYNTECGDRLKLDSSNRMRKQNPAKDPNIMSRMKARWAETGRGIGEKNGNYKPILQHELTMVRECVDSGILSPTAIYKRTKITPGRVNRILGLISSGISTV